MQKHQTWSANWLSTVSIIALKFDCRIHQYMIAEMQPVFAIFLSLVHIFALCVLFMWELEQVVFDTAQLEVTNLDGGMENTHFDADARWIVSYAIQHDAGLFDALYAFLGFQRDGKPFFLFVLDAVLIVVGVEFKLSSILVSFVGMGIIDGHRVLFALQSMVRYVVVPGDVFLVDKLTFFLFHPDGALSLVDANDVYLVM